MLTPEQIEQKQFTVVRLTESGYRQTEVDDFLDELHSAYSQVWADAGRMQAQLKAGISTVAMPIALPIPAVAVEAPASAAVEVVSHAAVSDGPSLASIGLLLKTAEDAAAKIVQEAKDAAGKALVDAGAQADKLLADARAEANVVKGQAVSDVAQAKIEATTFVAQLRNDASEEIGKLKVDAKDEIARLGAEAKDERAKIVAALEADKVKLLGHVGQLSSTRDTILATLKEVVAKVEGK